MSIKYSDGFRKALAGPYGWRSALANGRLRVYSGSQPASANDAVSGTLLATFTLSGGTYTAETRGTATITLTGGASGSIDTVKLGQIPLIGAAVNYNTSLNQTAADLATAINNYLSMPDFTATSSGAVVTVYAPFTLGAAINTASLTVTKTTLTTSEAAFASGVTAVNGLNWAYPDASGVLSKESTVWQATAVATGTAGYFRYESDGNDDQGASTTFRRFDGTIATTGGDLNLSNTSIASGAVQTINLWTITIPAS